MEAAAIFRGNGAPHTSDVPDIPQMQPHTHQAQELLQELQHETPPAVDLHVLSLEKTPHGNVHPGQSGTLLHDLSDATISAEALPNFDDMRHGNVPSQDTFPSLGCGVLRWHDLLDASKYVGGDVPHDAASYGGGEDGLGGTGASRGSEGLGGGRSCKDAPEPITAKSPGEEFSDRVKGFAKTALTGGLTAVGQDLYTDMTDPYAKAHGGISGSSILQDLGSAELDGLKTLGKTLACEAAGLPEGAMVWGDFSDGNTAITVSGELPELDLTVSVTGVLYYHNTDIIIMSV